MDAQLLERLLALAAQTGDRLIVVDPQSRTPVVLMGLAQYEQLVHRGGGEVAPRDAFAQVLAPEREEDASEGVIPPWSVVADGAPSVSGSGRGVFVPQFTPEPLQSATPDDERFYVEPLE